MSKDKQIEKISKILCGMKNGCDGCMFNKVHCNERNYAEEIYNAGYRKQSEWIGVEERLPEPNEKCLVAVKVGDRVVMDLGERIRCINSDNWESYYEWLITYDWGDDGEDCEITHWMPLPEAPKGGAE